TLSPPVLAATVSANWNTGGNRRVAPVSPSTTATLGGTPGPEPMTTSGVPSPFRSPAATLTSPHAARPKRGTGGRASEPPPIVPPPAIPCGPSRPPPTTPASRPAPFTAPPPPRRPPPTPPV